MNEPISTIMVKDVLAVSPKDKLSKVRDLLMEKHFHHLPVVDNKKLVGILSSYDMVKLDVKQEEYDRILVSDIMTTKIVTLEPDDKIGAAAQVFLRHLFHGLPIVNGKKELVGIITTHDILKYHFDKEYPGDDLEQAFRKAGQI